PPVPPPLLTGTCSPVGLSVTSSGPYTLPLIGLIRSAGLGIPSPPHSFFSALLFFVVLADSASTSAAATCKPPDANAPQRNPGFLTHVTSSPALAECVEYPMYWTPSLKICSLPSAAVVTRVPAQMSSAASTVQYGDPLISTVTVSPAVRARVATRSG